MTASKMSLSFGPNTLVSSRVRSELRGGMSKIDQLRVDDSGELKPSSMTVFVEGPGEKMEEGGSRTQAGEGSDPSFTSGLPEIKLE